MSRLSARRQALEDNPVDAPILLHSLPSQCQHEKNRTSERSFDILDVESFGVAIFQRASLALNGRWRWAPAKF